jgi:hypothetical protein
MAGLLDFITEAAKKQYAQGAPYRQAVTGLLQGDTSKANTLLDRGIESLRTPEGAMDVALNFSPMMLGTFIGKNSKLWNSSKADIAQQLEKSGVSPEEIWRQTGTVRGVDGKLRQEISDVGSKITDNVYEGIVKNKRFEGKMGDALLHPELYKAYPDTADIGTGMYAWNTPEGTYEKVSRTITAGGPGTTSQKSAALHEIQHDIQQKEGFASGGNLQSFMNAELGLEAEKVAKEIKNAQKLKNKNEWLWEDATLKDIVNSGDAEKNIKDWANNVIDSNKIDEFLFNTPSSLYNRLAGEAEARLTQRRMNLTPEQRLQYFPYNQGKEVYGLDVPYNDLIIRGLLE